MHLKPLDCDEKSKPKNLLTIFHKHKPVTRKENKNPEQQSASLTETSLCTIAHYTGTFAGLR